MPNTYNANAAGFDPTVGVTLSQPVDLLDPVTAASEGAELQHLADGLEHYRLHAAFRDLATTISGAWTFSSTPGFNNGIRVESTTDTNASIANLTNPTGLHAHRWRSAIGGTSFFHVIGENTPFGVSHVVNASVDNTNAWNADDAAVDASRQQLTTSTYKLQYKSAAATWAEAAWTTPLSVNLATGALTLTGGIMAASAVFAGSSSITSGSFTVGGALSTTGANDITAGEDLIATRKVIAQTARSSATPGVGQSVAAGEVWKDGAVLAWAKVTAGAGTANLTRGYNINSVTWNSTGNVTVTLANGAANVLVPNVTRLDTTGGQSFVDSGTITASSFRVLSKDSAGTSFVDQSFFVVVYGG